MIGLYKCSQILNKKRGKRMYRFLVKIAFSFTVGKGWHLSWAVGELMPHLHVQLSYT